MIHASENIIETLTLKEASRLLHCKDLRTVQHFCERHGVKLFSIANGKTKYVLKIEFYLALYKNLKSQEGINLLEYAESVMKVFSQHFVEREQIKIDKNYKPVGQNEKQFATLLKSIS